MNFIRVSLLFHWIYLILFDFISVFVNILRFKILHRSNFIWILVVLYQFLCCTLCCLCCCFYVAFYAGFMLRAVCARRNQQVSACAPRRPAPLAPSMAVCSPNWMILSQLFNRNYVGLIIMLELVNFAIVARCDVMAMSNHFEFHKTICKSRRN